MNKQVYINKLSLLKQNSILAKKESKDSNETKKTNTNSKQAYLSAYKEIIKNILDPTSGMSEAKKASFQEKINRKIQCGEKLTPEELRYLQLTNPTLYLQIIRVQMQRENLENRLEQCHSQEEARDIYSDAVLMVPEDDPARTAILAAYQNVMKEFTESGDYDSLPQTLDTEEDDDIFISTNLSKKKNATKNTDIDDTILDELYFSNDSQDLSYLNINA